MFFRFCLILPHLCSLQKIRLLDLSSKTPEIRLFKVVQLSYTLLIHAYQSLLLHIRQIIVLHNQYQHYCQWSTLSLPNPCTVIPPGELKKQVSLLLSNIAFTLTHTTMPARFGSARHTSSLVPRLFAWAARQKEEPGTNCTCMRIINDWRTCMF